jgi:Flp pilus assembly protein TadG
MQTSKSVNCEKQSLIVRLCSRIRGDKGSALVELALTVPLVTLLLVGAAEFAQVEYASIEVADAALAGVQYGALDPINAGDTTGISTAAQDDAPNITLGTTTATQTCVCSNANGTTVTCGATDCPSGTSETILTVSTQATITPLVELPGLPTTYAVHGQAAQKVLQ